LCHATSAVPTPDPHIFAATSQRLCVILDAVPDALKITALSKTYGSAVALAGVDLRVGEGELVGLLGPNGAGKSTLTKIACGLVRPTGGHVEVLGEPCGSKAARAQTGYLAELFRFPGWATADEVLLLHQRLARSPGGAGERERLLALVELTQAAARRVEAMSKGMQQRLGIAQALVGDPRIVLLDEPTSALDPAGRRTVRELLDGLRGRGVAVLLNSHLLSEVELVCDRVVIVDKGRTIAEGAPADLVVTGGVEIETASGPKRYPDAGREDIPDLIAGLVAEGERIYGARVVAGSLEDTYLGLVGAQES
jgi:ABC-2 type transport system ATP-binding protein